MGGEYVGIDLHRRRSVIVRMDAEGTVLSKVRIDNSPTAFVAAVAEAGPEPEVVLEATYGWYWVADALEGAGARVRLAHPLGMKGMTEHRRVKNDLKDAMLLADLARMNRLPEAWIAPREVRELRELVRYRAKLVALRAGLKAQVHAVMAKEGVLPQRRDMFGLGGSHQLDTMVLAEPYQLRLDSLRCLIAAYDGEIASLDNQLRARLKDHTGYRAIQQLHGVGAVLAAIFVAEIGDVSRFARPEQLCSWAGLTPKHRQSDETVTRGRITKQGSTLLRWAAIEAVSKIKGGPKLQADYHRIADRRGKNKARVAVARKLLTLVYYGLRDGEIRCLATTT